MSDFVHLHTHSHYSLLNALPKIPELVEAAKKQGMKALALTDNGNLYGAIEFYKECLKNDIKPIIGIDAYIAARTRIDREPRIDSQRTRLILLAKDEAGYKNLLKLVTKSNLEGFYYKPRLDKELIETHYEGLIAILPSFSSGVSTALKQHDASKAREILSWYERVFGKENVYLEITHHPEIDGHEALQAEIIKISKESGVPLVAAHDVYYIAPEDRRARETMIKIQSGMEYGDHGGMADEGEDFSFIDQKTAEEYFKDNPEAIENTSKIAERCTLNLELGKWVTPHMVVESGLTPDQELERLVSEGLEKKGLPQNEEYKKRIEHELSVIEKKGYSPYFLVVADLLNFSRENGILTTTRGSAGGSLVSYLTGITNVNPIEYGLPFERFLNLERPTAPDIDMDYADNRRDEVIEYARRKYGDDHVAQIGTFGTMMARGSVRDIARALGYPYATGDRIAKMIPMGSQGFPMTINKALELIPELKEIYKTEDEAKEIIDLALKIEGCARHISVHAAGVVIAPTPLTEWTPLQFDPKGGKLITQYDMYSISDEYGGVGLLKFDFLGIKNLSILADSVKRVKKIRNIDIDIENIPLDDKKTYEMLGRGETHGLFQLGGSGMTRYLKELRPTTIHDINAMVALYRPGPMDVIPQYIERKNNPHLVHYPDPRMKKYLDKSYGLIVYQDDLLYSTVELAGYSWVEADKFRKAVGKKNPVQMAAQKEKLIAGVIKNGQTQAFAERLWKLFEPFQAYGFNKAHAASYGKVAYQTAYMKANFPLEYMAAVLTADSGDVEKIGETIIECKRMGIAVLPPSVNESYADFSVVPDSGKPEIRFGLCSIKNFGEGIANIIIEERKEKGSFSTLTNFLERIQDRNLNKKSLEALIKSGALDEFEDRAVLLQNLDRLLTYHKESVGSENQDSLFGGATPTSSISLEPTEPATKADRLRWEKELLGLYVSGHPLDSFEEKLKKRTHDINKLKEEVKDGMLTVATGIVEEMKTILTKKGERMAFARISDYAGSIEVVVFPRVFTQFQDLLAPEQVIAIKGRLSGRNGEKSIIAEAVKAL